MKSHVLALFGFVIALLAVNLLLLPTPESVSAQVPSTPAAIYTVTVGPAGSLVFSPVADAIPLNSTVNWVWASISHSTTSGTCSGTTCTPDSKWDSGVQNVPFSFSHSTTFTSAGVYPYFCLVHGGLSGMRGTITVGPTAVNLVSATVSSESPLERILPYVTVSFACAAGIGALRWAARRVRSHTSPQ